MHDCGLLCLPCEHFMRQCLLAVRDPMHCMLRAHLPLGWPGPSCFGVAWPCQRGAWGLLPVLLHQQRCSVLMRGLMPCFGL